MIDRFLTWLHKSERNNQPKTTSFLDIKGKKVRGDPSPRFEIQPDDPIVDYFLSRPLTTEINQLDLDSPTLKALRKAGIKVSVPLVSQGQLIGMLNLGPRLSELDYSTNDRRLLDLLSSHVAPTLRVAQLVRQQQAEVVERERMEYELRVAALIQQRFLPKQMPNLPRWKIAAHYQPAHMVGGDFYDFQLLSDGRLAIVIGDVADHGIPAALLMVGTRAILRDSSRLLDSPAAILERANNLLISEIPSSMFVTCLFAILEPQGGRLLYANAGQTLPILRRDEQVDMLYATGFPLGIMPDVHYEEKETIIGSHQSVLFYSDGLVEARNPGKVMFGEERIKEIVSSHSDGRDDLIATLLCEMNEYTGLGTEQEDDVTLVTLQHS